MPHEILAEFLTKRPSCESIATYIGYYKKLYGDAKNSVNSATVLARHAVQDFRYTRIISV